MQTTRRPTFDRMNTTTDAGSAVNPQLYDAYGKAIWGNTNDPS